MSQSQNTVVNINLIETVCNFGLFIKKLTHLKYNQVTIFEKLHKC